MLFPMPDTGWVVGLVTPESRIVGLAKVMMQDVLEVLIPIMTLLLVGSWLVVRRLISRLDDTRQALDDIAQGEGDLTRRLDVRGKDDRDWLGRKRPLKTRIKDLKKDIINAKGRHGPKGPLPESAE